MNFNLTVRKVVRVIGRPRKGELSNACTITPRSRVLVKTKRDQFNARAFWGLKLTTRTKTVYQVLLGGGNSDEKVPGPQDLVVRSKISTQGFFFPFNLYCGVPYVRASVEWCCVERGRLCYYSMVDHVLFSRESEIYQSLTMVHVLLGKGTRLDSRSSHYDDVRAH